MTTENERNADVQRDSLPAEVYAEHTNFVRLAMKTMTAKRMVGWLRGYADYCDVAGHDKSAEHARHVANNLAREVDPDKVEPADAPKDAHDDPVIPE